MNYFIYFTSIKIYPNKTVQSFINVAASPKIHVPVTAAIIRFLKRIIAAVTGIMVKTIIPVTLRRIHKPSGESPNFVSLNIPFLVKGTKKVSFVSLH